MLGFGLWSVRLATEPLLRPDQDDEDRDALIAAEYLGAALAPDDWLVTDSLTLAFLAQRNVPPEMVNVSSWRIRSGHIADEQAIAWTERYQPQAIVFWDDRLEELTSYVDWVQANHYLTAWYGKERRIYQPGVGPEHVVQALFEGLWLEGYTLQEPLQGEDSLSLILYWRATDGPAAATTELSLAALDGQGQAHELLKTKLADGEMRPSHWTDGDRVMRTYHLSVNDLEQGGHTLRLTLLHGEEIIAVQTGGEIKESIDLASW